MKQASSLSLVAVSAEYITAMVLFVMCGPTQGCEAEEMRCSAPIDPNEWSRAQELGGDGAAMV